MNRRLTNKEPQIDESNRRGKKYEVLTQIPLHFPFLRFLVRQSAVGCCSLHRSPFSSILRTSHFCGSMFVNLHFVVGEN